MKLRTLFSIPVLIGALAATQHSYALNLHDVVQETLATNPDVLIDVNTQIASQYAVKEVRGDLFPSLDIAAGVGKERSKNGTVTARLGKRQYDTLTRKESSVFVNQLLFDGLGTINEMNRLKSESKASAFRVNATSQDIALLAVETYLDILRLKKNVEYARHNVQAHRTILKKIRSRDKQGVGLGVDLTQAEGRLALAISNLEAEQSSLRDSEITFTRIVGIAPDNLEDTKLDFPIPDSESELEDMAVAGNPRLKEAGYDVKEALYQHRVAKAAFSPRFDLEFGGSWNRNIDGSPLRDFDQFGMVRMTYNVFRGGGDLARVRETAYIVQRAQEIQNRTYREVLEEARLAWNALYTTRERLPELIKHRNASKETVKAYTKQFTLGKRTLLDVLDQESEYFRSRIAVEADKFEHALSHYRMLNIMGSLVQTLGVPLPQEAYYRDLKDKRFNPYDDGLTDKEEVAIEEGILVAEADLNAAAEAAPMPTESAPNAEVQALTIADAKSKPNPTPEETFVSPDAPKDAAKPSSAVTRAPTIHIATFSNPARADSLTEKLKNEGFNAFQRKDAMKENASEAAISVLVTPADASTDGIRQTIGRLEKSTHIKGMLVEPSSESAVG